MVCLGEFNWGPASQWFAGAATLTGVAAALGIAMYGYIWRRPRLDLSCPPPGYLDQQNTRGLGVSPETISRWFRVRVENRLGRRTAKNCRGYLVGVRMIREDGTAQEFLQSDVRQMFWQHGEEKPESRDLVAGVPHQLDLVAAVEGSRCLSFRVFPLIGWHQPGRYVLTVHVTAEDAHPAGIQVTLDWDGTRESFRLVSAQTLTL